MATVEDVARAIVRDLELPDGGSVLSSQWVIERYQDFCNRVKPNHLRKMGQLRVSAPVTAGTVTVTRDSRVVTGNAAAQAAWHQELIGFWFRAREGWYRISGLQAGNILLEVAFGEATGSGLSYRILPRQLSFPKHVRHVKNFVDMISGRELISRSLEELDRFHPSRPSVGANPLEWAIVESVADEAIAVEIYPYPTNSRVLHYTYFSFPNTLLYGSDIPSSIDVRALKEGVMIDALRWKMDRAAEAGKIELAALYRNEYRAQETRWEKILTEIAAGERANEDTSFQVSLTRFGRRSEDITTARDDVLLDLS